MLDVGERVPDFTGVNQNGERVGLKDVLGQKGLVIFFYPKDGTAVCTKEVCAFRDSFAKFQDAGFDVIGISGDSSATHQSFASEHQLPFPLLSDRDGAIRKAFGVSKILGLIPSRVTFVLDAQGIVRRKFSALLASDEHVQQALEAVS